MYSSSREECRVAQKRMQASTEGCTEDLVLMSCQFHKPHDVMMTWHNVPSEPNSELVPSPF